MSGRLNLKTQSAFFGSQRQGRWRWPWLLVSIPGAAIVAIAGLGVVYELTMGADAVEADELLPTTDPGELVTENLALFVPLWLAAIAGVLIHGRRIRALVAPLHRFSSPQSGWSLTWCR